MPSDPLVFFNRSREEWKVKHYKPHLTTLQHLWLLWDVLSEYHVGVVVYTINTRVLNLNLDTSFVTKITKSNCFAVNNPFFCLIFQHLFHPVFWNYLIMKSRTGSLLETSWLERLSLFWEEDSFFMTVMNSQRTIIGSTLE